MKTTPIALMSALLAFAIGFSFQAQARKPKMYTIESKVVGTFLSEVGEPKMQFYFRIASLMQAWTAKNNAETCGYFSQNEDGQWGIILVTQKSQVMCISDTRVLPKGMTVAADNIHSHPPRSKSGRLELTPETLAAAKAIGDDSYDRKFGRITITAPKGFSKNDFANGPGYLVDSGRLLYQKGTRKVVDLGPVQ